MGQACREGEIRAKHCTSCPLSAVEIPKRIQLHQLCGSHLGASLTCRSAGRMHWECAHAIFSITIVMLPAPSTRLT